MSNQSITEYLSAHEFFSEFSDDDLKFLCECSSTREIKKGQILFLQGEHADKFYVVRSGAHLHTNAGDYGPDPGDPDCK